MGWHILPEHPAGSLLPLFSKGDKSITVTVVHGDQTEKVFEYDTDEEYLGPVVTKFPI